jgi:hypothetical protein
MANVKALILLNHEAKKHLDDELARLHKGNPKVTILGFDIDGIEGFTSVDIVVRRNDYRGYAKRNNYTSHRQDADEQNDEVALSVALGRALRRADLK